LPRRALAFAVAGALTIAWSSILVEWADVSPETAAIFRCVYALPLLYLLAVREDRRFGDRDPRSRRLAAAAGVFFAADLIFWHHAIADVGAGLATVLGNLQVAFVPLVAWLVLKEHPSRRVLATLPVVLIGVVLVSGALESTAFGDNPTRGAVFGLLTGAAYAGFILTLRAGSADLRRPAGPLFDATAVSAVAAAIVGALLGRADFVPSWPEHGWLVLLALSSQVLGWMLISTSLPRLPAAITSILLTIQPVGSMILGALLLGEDASALQLLGVVFILTGLVAVASTRGRAPVPAPVPGSAAV
jgi:drug/metabolite transporter (DMT)-like permease